MNKVLDFTAMLVVHTMSSVRKFKEDFTSDERGALTFVEIALMVLVVVALAFVFKKQLISLINRIFGTVNPDELQSHDGY